MLYPAVKGREVFVIEASSPKEALLVARREGLAVATTPLAKDGSVYRVTTMDRLSRLRVR